MRALTDEEADNLLKEITELSAADSSLPKLNDNIVDKKERIECWLVDQTIASFCVGDGDESRN